MNYPNATELNPPSATTHYNCHSYAWYRSEGGDKNVWMGLFYSNSENIYWNDGSYIEVSSINDADKISYTGNHSAISLSGTNCRSKWGAWGLIEHDIGYGSYIYQMNNRKYYVKFKVDDPQVTCSDSIATFTTPDYVDCTYYWTYNTNLLDYISVQGTNTFFVETKTLGSQGEAWVKLELTINLEPDVIREITKNVWVGVTDDQTSGFTLECGYDGYPSPLPCYYDRRRYGFHISKWMDGADYLTW